MIEYMLKRKKITLLFFIMFVVVGFLSFFQLPHQENPDISVTFASITTIFPGASPEKVEQTVTKKLEAKIKEIQGLKMIVSSSLSGVSVIWVEAKDGVDPKIKWDELRKKVKDAEKDLPSEVKQPIINDDISKTFLQTFNITAASQEQLFSLRELFKDWKEQLRTIPGVADVQISGLPEQEVKIEIDAKKLHHFGIPWQQVVGAFKAYNERIPLGDIDIKNRTYQLKLKEGNNAGDLNNILITRSKDGFPVYLKDIAKITLTTEKIKYYAHHNGKPAVSFSIISETGGDVPSLQQKVDKMVASQVKALPGWAQKKEVYSQSERVNELFKDLTRETLIAIAAVILVCSLGLNFITASVVALAIPISLAVGMLFAPVFGITLNQISIVSLIIVLGILVDDAVVVNDNIERRLSVLAENPFEAAVNGANEVFISILTATLATIASFAPLVFLSGNTGQFIRPIPIIISFAMLASMVTSLTIIPIFREWYERRRKKDAQDYLQPAGLLGNQIFRLTEWYAHVLMPKILKRPLRVGVIGVLICTAAYGLIPFTPIQIFPNADRSEMLVDIKVPSGSSIKETYRIVSATSDWILKQPGVKMVAAYAGGSAPKMFVGDISAGEGVEVGQLVVKVDRNVIKTADVVKEWHKKLKGMFPEANIIPKELAGGPPVGKPVVIRIYGKEIETLRSLSQTIQDKVNKISGTYNVKDDLGIEGYALEFKPNQQIIDEKLVNYKDLTSTIRLVGEGIPAGDFDDGKNLIETKFYVEGEGKDPFSTLHQLTVPNLRGEQIPLMELVQVKPGFSIRDIPHRDLSRCITISSEVRGRTATEVMKEVKPQVASINFPEGYRWEIAGEISEQNDIFADMAKLSIIVIFLIVIMIAMQFYSLSLPLLVMSTAYLAFAGSLIGLFITRTPLGFMTMMGAISLLGIVVRNGIVLIEFIEKARESGVELKQAVINAGEARLRPILLTSATAVAGLLPLAFSGDVLFQPLAVTIISGLIFSTALTLIIVPSLYTSLALRKMKKRRIPSKECSANR